MMGNLMPFLQFKYGDDEIRYFSHKTQIECKDDKWDEDLKRVICKTEKLWKRRKNTT